KLLKHRLSQITEEQKPSEIRFHNEMTEIFSSLRDLHTNYLLSAPFNEKIAFLPFFIEEYYDNGQKKYLVSNVFEGFNHPTFKPGVEVLYWNGIVINRAIELNADRQAGSNLEARNAQGINSMTIRPLIVTLPPDEEWVIIGYRSPDGQELEFKQPWQVYSPEYGGGVVDPNSLTPEALGLGFDIKTDAIHQAKKALFASEAVAAEKKIMMKETSRAAPPHGLATSMPTVFRASNVETDHGTYGYIRIFTFNVDNADDFVTEFVHLVQLLSKNGLIVDVRDNGGGYICASECLLQVLTPNRIKPEPMQFINTPLTYEICRRNSQGPELSSWINSINLSIETGATFSQSFSITSEKSCNAIGQKYNGPVLLITNALCYSATDMFAAGFQDNKIGPILGTNWNTGAGGANVWTHKILSTIMSEENPPFKVLSESPFKSLPNGAGMRVSIRRSLRVHEHEGMPLEDLGVVPDYKHDMTEKDLIYGNVDLINCAAEILAKMPVYVLSANINSSPEGTLSVNVTSKNISRLDVFLDDRPAGSRNINDGLTQIDLEIPLQGASFVELRGFDDNRHVATLKELI
ncbi:MAG: hypothetical protein K8R25_04560, partial [Methanosarcinales archaeon]|nr:hypothetical protein [Methanosarcinales archaeon]